MKALKCPQCGAKLVSRYETNCPNCAIELASDEEDDFFPEEDVLETGNFDPENVWLMTDLVAKANYKFQGELKELKQDIRFNVMRGKPWGEDDIDYLREIKRLLDEGSIKRTTSYWHCSPFPTVFKALRKGTLSIVGNKYRFSVGDEIVWRCLMGRELLDLDGPPLIGEFAGQTMARYCKDMENAMKSMGRKGMTM